MPVESMRKALKTQRFQGFVYCAEGGKMGMRAGNRAVPVGIADSECIVVLVWV